MDFTTELEKTFLLHADSEKSIAMAKYMKNHFVFFGIPSPLRKTILQNLLKNHKDEIHRDGKTIALQLYQKPQREFHYCAIELLIKHTKKNFQREDAIWIEEMLLTHSWWDSVDPISKYLLGGYLNQFPDQTDRIIDKFSNSPNMWLNRSCILFQLGYKKNTNFKQMKYLCDLFKNSNAFFIQKAIGWALREYAKTAPEEVKAYVKNTTLKPLSQREALKNIEKT